MHITLTQAPILTLQSLILGKYHYIGARLGQTSDSANNTPLHIAARRGHVEPVKVCAYLCVHVREQTLVFIRVL